MVDEAAISKAIKDNIAESEAAEQLGITDKKLLLDHPEVAKARAAIENAPNKVLKKTALIAGGTGISTAVGVPFLLKTRIGQSLPVRIAVGLATAATATVAAGVTAVYALVKSFEKQDYEATKLENKALLDELSHIKGGMEKLAQVQEEMRKNSWSNRFESLKEANNSFTETVPPTVPVAPRDESHAAQAQKESEQPKPIAMSA